MGIAVSDELKMIAQPLEFIPAEPPDGFLARLKEVGYSGPITIEREISGPQQTADILAAKRYLEGLIG